MLMDESVTYRRLRAPREHGQVLIEPAPSMLDEVVVGNTALRDGVPYDLQGRDLLQLATSARAELIDKAHRYTAQYRDVTLRRSAAERLFLAGHQPELFHPGVWFKNVALAHLADQQDAVAVNLLIDNDVCRSSTLRVPGGSVRSPVVELVPFDQQAAETPYEERTIHDAALFESFSRRAAEVIRPLMPETLLEDYWSRAVARSHENTNLGQSFAQARHQMEGECGLQTLEIPQSTVCQMEAFHWFTAHLLAQLPRFWDVYNSLLREYRREYHVRSHAHPVPNLSQRDGCLEAPFWIWSEADPRRRPMFACVRGDQMVISDRGKTEIVLDLTPDGSAEVAVAQLADLSRQGIKIRSRALVTTMFARLLLSDLFLHGIGGAKYDELTDRLIHRFFQLRPPEFLVVSATWRLPIDRTATTLGDQRQIEYLLRELTYHPEQYVDRRAVGDGRSAAELATESDESLDALIGRKEQWIRTAKTPENAHTRHLEISRVNTALQPWISPQRAELLAQRDTAAAAVRAEAILSARDYAFCLQRKETLSDLILEMQTHTA